MESHSDVNSQAAVFLAISLSVADAVRFCFPVQLPQSEHTGVSQRFLLLLLMYGVRPAFQPFLPCSSICSPPQLKVSSAVDVKRAELQGWQTQRGHESGRRGTAEFSYVQQEESLPGKPRGMRGPLRNERGFSQLVIT